MSNKIKKINNLKKQQGFLQLNFYKGFKYVDKAGEFLNSFYSENMPHVMDPTGLTVQINDKIQLKTSPHHIWMRILEPETFDSQLVEFRKKINLANSLFEPEKYTRIGWRNYLIYESGDTYPEIIPVDILKNADFKELVFTKKINNFDLRISVSKLVKEGSSLKAVLFDIDVSRKEDIDKNDFSKINTYLKEMEATYKSEDLLEVVNSLLK